jgi:hypothetical protein
MTDDIDPAVTAPAVPVAATVASVPPSATTVKVRIDAGGREIELETTDTRESVDALATTALALWKATDQALYRPEAGSLFGLVASERAPKRGPSSTLQEPVDVPE